MVVSLGRVFTPIQQNTMPSGGDTLLRVQQLRPPLWRRVTFGAFAVVGILVFFVTAGAAAQASLTPGGGSGGSGYVHTGKGPAFGTCSAQPSVVAAPLRWKSKDATADHICCKNHKYAEYSGYWLSTDFPKTLPDGQTITFYDVASGLPLFKAPVGRSWSDFYSESRHHGWPSFRDQEVVWENVKVLGGGETVSVNGTVRWPPAASNARATCSLARSCAPRTDRLAPAIAAPRAQPARFLRQPILHQHRLRGWPQAVVSKPASVLCRAVFEVRRSAVKTRVSVSEIDRNCC